MLGTNDSKKWNWKGEAQYKEDLMKFINQILEGQSKLQEEKPDVYLMIPPPVYGDIYGMQEDIINKLYPQIIPQIANEMGLKLINLFEALGGAELKRPELISDLCHPNEQGYKEIAQCISE